MGKSLENYLDKITGGDCLEHLPLLPRESIHLCLSDIPYGINLADWDVLHCNTNSALLGQSPAQRGKAGFKRRGKPINGWNAADRNIPKEYQAWCRQWTEMLFPLMKEGASVLIFGARRTLHRAIVAFEESGFLLRDILAWEKSNAHHRAQSLENLVRNRGLTSEAERWVGWKVGSLAPLWEPIAWFFKPYRHTILDNVLEHEVGAINIADSLVEGRSPTNVLRFDIEAGERLHEAQKPLELIKYLIRLTTREGQVVLDPFMGSGTTALAARDLGRRFIGFEANEQFCQIALERLQRTALRLSGGRLSSSAKAGEEASVAGTTPLLREK
jgi:site-specific DNA-methyltransferase (adenine-specific)